MVDRLSDNIRDHAVLDIGDFVSQPQLAPLEPRKLQLVGRSRTDERTYGGVEIAMFNPQAVQTLFEVGVVHRLFVARTVA